MLFSICGSMLLVSANSLVLVYLTIELQSFAVYVIAAIYRDSESSASAGLKYFMLGSLSSCLILLGIGLVYSYTGITSLDGLYTLLEVHSGENLTTTLGPAALGLTVLGCGLLFKVFSSTFS